MFRPLSLSPPASLESLSNDIAPTLGAVSGSLSQGAGSLGSLGLPGLPPLPDLPGSPSADSMRGGQSALLSRKAQCLMVSPYDYGTGQRKGEAAILTPLMALRNMGTRLGGLSVGDMGDMGNMSGGALVCIMACAADQRGLASALASLNAAYPLPELQRLERRARNVSTLEKDKLIIPSPPSQPPFGAKSPEGLPLSRQSSRAVGALLAQAEGREASAKAPADVLASFGQRQQQTTEAMQAELASIAQQLASPADLSAWFGLYLEGTAAAVARLLAGYVPPVDDVLKCSTMLCWYGNKAEVAYYKELFGL